MKEQFVTYEIALILKEKGFDELTFGFYWMDTKQLVYDSPYTGKHHGVHLQAPLWQQVIDWLEYKGLWITITPPYEDLKFEYTIHQLTKTSKLSKKLLDGFDFNTKYKARQAAIEKALTLI